MALDCSPEYQGTESNLTYKLIQEGHDGPKALTCFIGQFERKECFEVCVTNNAFCPWLPWQSVLHGIKFCEVHSRNIPVKVQLNLPSGTGEIFLENAIHQISKL